MKASLLILTAAVCNAFSPPVSRRKSMPLALGAGKIADNSVTGDSHHELSNLDTSRRNAISIVAMATVASINNQKAQAATQASASAFLGTYSDPINHPGGKRTIKLLGDTFGDYTLAEVYGGGGVGEPKEYVLPAMILGDRAIIIDFSPKGGPRDFTGVLEKDGSIKFLRDGNRWPRIE